MKTKLMLSAATALALLAAPAAFAAEEAGVPGAATANVGSGGADLSKARASGTDDVAQEAYASRLTPQKFVNEVAGHNWQQKDIIRNADQLAPLTESAQQLARQVSEYSDKQLEQLKALAESKKVDFPETAKPQGVYKEVPAGDKVADTGDSMKKNQNSQAFAQRLAESLEAEKMVLQRASQLDDQDLKSFADQAMPGVEQHLKTARAVIDGQALAKSPDDAAKSEKKSD